MDNSSIKYFKSSAITNSPAMAEKKKRKSKTSKITNTACMEAVSTWSAGAGSFSITLGKRLQVGHPTPVCMHSLLALPPRCSLCSWCSAHPLAPNRHATTFP